MIEKIINQITERLFRYNNYQYKLVSDTKQEYTLSTVFPNSKMMKDAESAINKYESTAESRT